MILKQRDSSGQRLQLVLFHGAGEVAHPEGGEGFPLSALCGGLHRPLRPSAAKMREGEGVLGGEGVTYELVAPGL